MARSVIECEQNRNLLTNFALADRPFYERVISIYGKGDVFITDDAYWMDGTLDTSMNALRCKNPKGDYSEFWRISADVENGLR